MKTISVQYCQFCPFITEGSPAECDISDIVNEEDGSKELIPVIPRGERGTVPPRWCPLRSSPVLVKVEGSHNG